jgi:hypothetical protein
MGGSPDPPAPPDYRGAAIEQGAANKEAAIASSRLNNPNVIGPYGTQTYQESDLVDGRPTMTQTLSPSQQRMLESGDATKIALSDLGRQGAEAASGVLGTPFGYSGISERSPYDLLSSATAMPSADFASQLGRPANLSPSLLAGAPGMRSTDFSGGAGVPAIGAMNIRANAPGMLSTDFTTGAPSMPGSADALRNQVYNASMARVNEDTGLARDQKHSTLIASGIPEGSKAYSDAMIGIDRGYNDARQQAILGAGAEAQRQFGMDLQARQQGVGERAQMFGAGTQAQQQAIQEQMQQQQADIAARQQGFTEQERMFGAGTTAQQQAISQQQQQFTAEQAARAQGFGELEKVFGASTAQRQQGINELMQQFNLSSEARRQQIAEALALRQTPLNEINALQSGSQINNPFAMAGYAQNANIQAAPLYQATSDSGQHAMDIYNQKAASADALTAGMFSLGSAGIKAASDRRCKRHICRIGTHPLGVGLYSFEYKPRYQAQWGRGPQVGVMAQEVLTVKPDAVSWHPDGYLMVDYGRLSA